MVFEIVRMGSILKLKLSIEDCFDGLKERDVVVVVKAENGALMILNV